MSGRRRFTKEYKLAAIQPLLVGAKSVSLQAEELGIGRTELQRWLGQYRTLGDKAFPGSGQQVGEAAELAELKRQLLTVQQERDILKKALASFSREQP